MTTELREKLADLEHQRWSRWMEYLFTKGDFNKKGEFIIDAVSVTRWQHQINTPYAGLSETEKDSDRAEADRTLRLLASYEQLLGG